MNLPEPPPYLYLSWRQPVVATWPTPIVGNAAGACNSCGALVAPLQASREETGFTPRSPQAHMARTLPLPKRVQPLSSCNVAGAAASVGQGDCCAGCLDTFLHQMAKWALRSDDSLAHQVGQWALGGVDDA